MSGGIAKLHAMANLFLFESIFIHVEVEQSNCIDMIEFEIPILSLWCLFTDRECGIEQRTVLEVSLIGILHFNDKLLSVFSFTVYVKDSLAVSIDIAYMFRVQILHILNNLFAIKQAVEKTNQQILIHCCSENSLETEVCKQTDISFFYLFHNHLF